MWEKDAFLLFQQQLIKAVIKRSQLKHTIELTKWTTPDLKTSRAKFKIYLT